MRKLRFKQALLTIGVLMMSTVVAKQATNSHWDAKLYKKNSILLQQTTAFELIEKLLIASEDEILDVGCGNGEITKRLAEIAKKGHVDGFDVSSDMIEIAKKDFANIKNLSFSVGNAEDIVSKKEYDWVTSFFCLQWVKDKGVAFKNIATYLRPGGKVAVILTDRNPYLLMLRRQLIKKPIYRAYLKDYKDETDVIDDDAYEAYAQKAGLINIQYSQTSKTVFFEDKEQLKTFIRMVTPILKQIPVDQLKEQFLNELIDGYLAIVPPQNGTHFLITYTIKILQAQKEG